MVRSFRSLYISLWCILRRSSIAYAILFPISLCYYKAVYQYCRILCFITNDMRLLFIKINLLEHRVLLRSKLNTFVGGAETFVWALNINKLCSKSFTRGRSPILVIHAMNETELSLVDCRLGFIFVRCPFPISTATH